MVEIVVMVCIDVEYIVVVFFGDEMWLGNDGDFLCGEVCDLVGIGD